mgnify:CR=1 FL=1
MRNMIPPDADVPPLAIRHAIVIAIGIVVALSVATGAVVTWTAGDDDSADYALLDEQQSLDAARNRRIERQHAWARQHERTWSTTASTIDERRQCIAAGNRWRQRLGARVYWRYTRAAWFSERERADPILAVGAQVDPQRLPALLDAGGVAVDAFDTRADEQMPDLYLSDRLFSDGREALALHGDHGVHVAIGAADPNGLMHAVLIAILIDRQAPEHVIARRDPWVVLASLPAPAQAQRLMQQTDLPTPLPWRDAWVWLHGVLVDHDVAARAARQQEMGALPAPLAACGRWMARYSVSARLAPWRQKLKRDAGGR